MTATVPDRRLIAGRSGVEIARPVRSSHWVDAARLVNWCAGQGTQEIPLHSPLTVVGPGATAIFRYRTKPRSQTVGYIWSIAIRDETGQDHIVRAPASTGVGAFVQGRTIGNTQCVRFVEWRAAQSDAETELSISIQRPGDQVTDDAVIEAIGCEAIPRQVLAATTAELGAPLPPLFPRAPILAQSLGVQVINRLPGLRDACRRIGMMQWAMGNLSPRVSNSTTFFNMMNGVGPPVLARVLYSGQTQRTLHARVYGRCVSSNGEVRLITKAGNHDIAVSGATAQWWPAVASAPANVVVDAEDITTAEGWRGGTPDIMRPQFRTGTTDQAIEIQSISIWEPT